MSAPPTPENLALRTFYEQIAADAGVEDPLARAVEVLDATWMETPSVEGAEWIIGLLTAVEGS